MAPDLLQAANVHAILEGGPMVASTVQRAGEAARAVEDLEETLAIFDLKLRHMREVRAALLLHQTCSPEGALQYLFSVRT